MKLSNIFKKETKKSNVKIEPVSKTQLSKVIGGGDGTATTTTTMETTTSRGKIIMDRDSG